MRGDAHCSAYCPSCDELRQVTLEVRRSIEAGRSASSCARCVAIRPTRYQAWWLARFTLPEIRWMAEGIDTLLNDHSVFAHDHAVDEAA